jgi:hypothetical protein
MFILLVHVKGHIYGAFGYVLRSPVDMLTYETLCRIQQIH